MAVSAQLSDCLGISDREAFERLRGRLEAMILIDVFPEVGEIYYYCREHAYAVWVVVGTQSLIVAYTSDERDLAGIRRHVELWDRARRDGLPLNLDDGLPVYAVTENPQTNQVTAAWFLSGDWLEVLMKGWKGKPSDPLPLWWSDADRARVSQLARERAKGTDRGET